MTTAGIQGVVTALQLGFFPQGSKSSRPKLEGVPILLILQTSARICPCIEQNEKLGLVEQTVVSEFIRSSVEGS